jgi:uncharacterized protein (TIGR02646 family)
MIKVNRNRIKTPGSLQTKGIAERAKAITHTQAQIQARQDNPEHKIKAFSFSAYKAQDVKAALDTLFHGKCAYCESVFASVHPMDVEHFRPKGRVTRWVNGKRKVVLRFGYYWLAAEWTNLLPSCIDCNRQRNQHELVASDDALRIEADMAMSPPDDPGSDLTPSRTPAQRDAELERVPLGKQDLFPVRGDTHAPSPEAFVAAPDFPLLLNPCLPEDDPADYLEFVDGAMVRPKQGSDASTEDKATPSIAVYGLNRSRLVYERQERALQIKSHLYTIERLAIAIERLDLRRRNDKQVAAILRDIMEHEMRCLHRFRRADQPYALMARQLIDRFFESL